MMLVTETRVEMEMMKKKMKMEMMKVEMVMMMADTQLRGSWPSGDTFCKPAPIQYCANLHKYNNVQTCTNTILCKLAQIQ